MERFNSATSTFCVLSLEILLNMLSVAVYLFSVFREITKKTSFPSARLAQVHLGPDKLSKIGLENTRHVNNKDNIKIIFFFFLNP